MVKVTIEDSENQKFEIEAAAVFGVAIRPTGHIGDSAAFGSGNDFGFREAVRALAASSAASIKKLMVNGNEKNPIKVGDVYMTCFLDVLIGTGILAEDLPAENLWSKDGKDNGTN
ncbi:MAG: hypothetical protein PHQ72_12145 [Hespellia sp.]|nr:hypothetical protein [Hespellia sp.]